jgi:hypothetical protein
VRRPAEARLNVQRGQAEARALERKVRESRDAKARREVVGSRPGVAGCRDDVREDAECGGQDRRVARFRRTLDGLACRADRRRGRLLGNMHPREREQHACPVARTNLRIRHPAKHRRGFVVPPLPEQAPCEPADGLRLERHVLETLRGHRRRTKRRLSLREPAVIRPGDACSNTRADRCGAVRRQCARSLEALDGGRDLRALHRQPPEPKRASCRQGGLAARREHTDCALQQPLCRRMPPGPREGLTAFRRAVEHTSGLTHGTTQDDGIVRGELHVVELGRFVDGHRQRTACVGLECAEVGEELPRAACRTSRGVEQLRGRRTAIRIEEHHVHQCDDSHTLHLHSWPFRRGPPERENDVASWAGGSEAGEHLRHGVRIFRLLAGEHADMPVEQRRGKPRPLTQDG